MASLLPSEVARLVLGYVESNGCQKSSENLLEELSELAECLKLRRKGRKVATRVGNQTLEDMLMDYSAAKDLVQESVTENPSTLASVPSSGSLLSQIKALLSIILNNKLVIKQHKLSIGTVSKVKQRTRMLRLQKDFQNRNSQQRFSHQPEDTLNATSPESLPGTHHQNTDHVEHLADHCLEKGRCRGHSHSSSHLPNSSQDGHIPHDVEDARQDSMGGDSTSTSLINDLDTSHQRRKGIVKRRSHGCEQTPTKISPVLDNEANFEKILKNLYENTALHEKIAESINRGLSTQCKAGSSHSEGNCDNVLVCNRKDKDSGSGSNTGEGNERKCGSVEEAAGSSVGGDVAFLKEFDHIVTGIVSEATSDPVFENLIDEVFGCISPQSGISKGDGPASSNQSNSQDHPNGPSRLLSTPVPPTPNSTPSSHSLLHMHQTLSLHQSSVSPTMCHQTPPHSLSTPNNRMLPISDTSHLSSSGGAQIPSFTSAPHSASETCKSFPELSHKKIEDVWSNRSFPHENRQGTKGAKTQSSDILRDAMQESLQNTLLNSTGDPTVNSWSSSIRMEAGDSSLTKDTSTVSSISCSTESPSLREDCERNRATPPSPIARNRSSRKKKCKKSASSKRAKEEDRNLGEQLLKEFADFQSSRPDKISDQEKRDSYKSTKRCEVYDKTHLQPHGLPVEEGGTKDQESGSDLENRLCEESVITTESRPETLSPVSQNTSKNQAAVLSAVSGKTVAVDEKHIDKSPVEMERNSQSNAEPDRAPMSTEALSVNPYNNDNNFKETEGKSSMVVLDSTVTLPVRSNTIPGLETSTASPEEDTYTLTELAPVNPLDLSSIVSSLCQVEGPDFNYPDPTQINIASSDFQASATSRCSSSVVHSSNIWDPSTEITHLNHVQEGTSNERQDQQGLTIILPPVSTKEQADEQFLSLFDGSQISNVEHLNPSLSSSTPVFTIPEPYDNASYEPMKKGRRKLKLITPNVKSEPAVIVHQSTSSNPLALGFVDSNEIVHEKMITTYTLPNSVTISIPKGIISSFESNDKIPKKRQRKNTSKKKEEPKKRVAKKAKEPKESTKTTNKKKPQYGRVVNMCEVKKRAPGRSKGVTKQKKKEAQEDIMSNNIIATALSFALNSVTPEKNECLPAEASVGETFHDVVMDVGVEVENAREVSDVANILGAPTANNDSSSGIDHSTKKGESVVQEQTSEIVVSNTVAQSTSKQTSAKCNFGRSPQLKALLQLSKSISPAKRKLACTNVSQSEESPRIRVLQMRGSQSTPSRKNSHIRVLDFGTPQKRKTFGGSPRKAVANLKFSPPVGKKSPKKSSKAVHILSRKFTEHSSTPSKTLNKIVEENETEDVLSKQGKVKSRKPLPRGSRDSSMFKYGKSCQKNNTKRERSKQNSMCSQSEPDFPRDKSQTPLLMTEDEESIVLHLDEDSLSSCGRTPPTDSGSIELFDLPKEQGCYQDLNFSTDIKDRNPDSVCDEDLPDPTHFALSSNMSEHSGARVKHMKTPCKAAHTSSSSVSMTPVCLVPPTPLLPSEQKSNTLPCDDLHTPIPQSIPNMNKTPLIKDYPQGPYSNSSVGTSYYMPSERSLTESEDYSPAKLDTLWEKPLTEERDSPTALDQSEADLEKDTELNKTSHYTGTVTGKSPNVKKSTVYNDKSDKVNHSPKKSPNKLSRKVMGEIIEREMTRLFSGQDSSSPSKEDNQVSLADVSNVRFSGTSDSTSKDSSKGKQGKKRRVPSKKYQSIAESACSEDEFDNRSENIRFANVHSNKKESEAPASRLKVKKSKRRSGRCNYSGRADELDKTSNIMTETQGKKHISSSPDISKNKILEKKSTALNGKGCSLLTKEELNLEDSSLNLRKANVIHIQDDHSQPSEKQNSLDLQESSCHFPNKILSSEKKKTVEGISEIDPKSLFNLFRFDTSSDSDSECLKRSSVMEQLPTQTENVPKKTHKADDRKAKLKCKTMLGSNVNLSDEAVLESPTKKRKISESDESFSSMSSTLENSKEKEVEEGNKIILRRSQRSTRARGVMKYQASTIPRTMIVKNQGNMRQSAPRGKGKRAGSVNIEEVVIEAVIETKVSCSSETVPGDSVPTKENAAKKDVQERRLSIKNVKGRSSKSPNSAQHPGQEVWKEDEECSDAPLSVSNIHASSKALDKPNKTEECHATIQKGTNEKAQDDHAFKLQQSSKEPSSCCGGGMKTLGFPRLKSRALTTAQALRVHWSNKLKKFSAVADPNISSPGDKGAKEQQCISTEIHHPQKEDNVTTSGDEGEKEQLFALTSETHQPQEENNTTLAGYEDETEQLCASTSETYLCQKKNDATSVGDKGSKKQPCTSIPEAHQPQENTTLAGDEGIREQPYASTLQPNQLQEEGGVCGSSQSQGCARTFIYKWSKSTVSLSQLQEMGDMGQIINITSEFLKIKKSIRKNPTVTSEHCVENKSTSKSTPEPSAGKKRTFTKTLDLVEQMSISKSSAQQKRNPNSTPKLSVEQKSNTQKSTPKLSVEQKSNTPKSTPELSKEQKSITPKSTPELSKEQKSNTPKSTPELSKEQKSNTPKSTPELSKEQKTNIPKSTPELSKEQKTNIPKSTLKLSKEQKTNIPKSTPELSVEQKSNTLKSTPELSVEQKSNTHKSTPEFSKEQKSNIPKIALELSKEQKSDICKKTLELSMEQKSNTPNSTPELSKEQKSSIPKSTPKLSKKQKSNIPKIALELSKEQKSDICKKTLELSMEQKSNTPKSTPELSKEQKSNTPKSTPELSKEQKSNIHKKTPELSKEQKSNIRKKTPELSKEQKSNIRKKTPELSKEQKSNIRKKTPELSKEQKSNIRKKTPELSKEQKSNIHKKTPELSKEQKRNIRKKTPELSKEQKSNTPKSTPELSTGDRILSKSTQNLSVARKNLSKSTPHPSTAQKSSNSKNKIQSFGGEGSADPRSSSPPIPSASDTVIGKSKMDTVSSGSKKPLSDSSHLCSPASPKEKYDNRPTPKTSSSEDTSKTQTSHDTVRMESTHTSLVLSPSSPHEHRKVGESLDQSCSGVQTVNNDAEVSSELPGDQNLCKKADDSNSLISETEHFRSPPRSPESNRDLEETSKDHCLLSYTALPPTPEKKLGRICHTIVKEGKAMVAFPSPSVLHPRPEPAAPQRNMINNKLKDQMDSCGSEAKHHLHLDSVYHSQSTCSIENEANQLLQEKPKKGDNSQVYSSNVKVFQENYEHLFRENAITTDYDQLKVSVESSLGKNDSIDQDNTQRKKRSQPSNTPQNIGNEEPGHQTHTNSEKPSTSFDITTNTNESSGKQIPAELKHFTAISQHYPEIIENDSCGQFREDDIEKMEEEEDSDVLRIEEPSENENEDSEEVICTLNLTFTELIDICSINIEPVKQKQKVKKKPTLLATRQKKQERKNSSLRKKAEKNLTQKTSQRHSIAPNTPKKNKSKKRKRSNGTTPESQSPMENQHHMKRAEGISTVEDRSDNTTIMKSLTTLSPKPPKKSDTQPRSQKKTQHGYYAGRSKPAESREESHSSTKKRRRITPTRIGDVEQHVKASRGSWGEAETPKKSHWGQNRVSTGVHQEMVEGRGGNLTQMERLGGGQGSLSERSASSLSSLSPGCLLISESPRGADSPAPLSDLTAPSSYTTPSYLRTTAPTFATPTKNEALKVFSSSSSASKLSLNNPRTGKQHGGADMYIIESETSRELEEDHDLGKQRKVRHMAQELHRGGNLEIARSPDKQLAIMMNHQQEGVNVYMSEESFHSLSRTPPTPGKHLFIPPPPILASSFSSSTSSSSSSFSHSHTKQDNVNLPLKKRK